MVEKLAKTVLHAKAKTPLDTISNIEAEALMEQVGSHSSKS